MRSRSLRAALWAQILSGSLLAYCGAKGSPQPPLPERPAASADAGPGDGGAP